MNTPLNVITLPLAQNNIIEASAGTGKTYTMVTLYLRLLLQAGENNFPTPLDIEQILVVTFTRDATRELRQRIRERTQSWLKLLESYQQNRDKSEIKDNELLALLPYLEDHLALAIQRLSFACEYIDKAAIFTIHGFCQRILRQYAFDSGLGFKFELSEQNQEQLRQVNYQLWRDKFYSISAEQAQIVRQVFVSPDKLFKQNERLLTGELPKVKQALPFTDISAGLDYYQQQLQQFQRLEQQYLAEFIDWFKQYEANLNQQRSKSKKFTDYFDAVISATTTIEQRISLAEKLLPIYFKKNKEVELPAFVVELEHFLQQFSQNDFCQKMHYLYVAELRQRIFEYQDNHNEKQFDDLLRMLRDVLQKPSAHKLIALIRQQYPFAMIDEFQDTDPVQLAIFSKIYLQAVTNETTTGFTVIGDPKQAIYRFRGADIFTYLSIKDSNDQHQSIENIYTLQRNYRSSTKLIESINNLFLNAKNPFYLDEIEFIPVEAAQQTSAFYVQGQVQKAWQLLQLTQDENKSVTMEIMAQAFASHLQQLLTASQQGNAYFCSDGQEKQAVSAKDIAILVRNGKESDIIRRALTQKGIASVYLSERSNVFTSVAAKDLYRILRACLTPFNERAVLAAVGCTLWGLTADQIYQLKQNETEWAALIERLLHYQTVWQTQGVLPMLYQLFQAEQIPLRLQQFDFSERYLVDLLHLSELLQQAMNQQQNEEALLNWFELQLSGNSDNEENRLRLEREQNVVSIITIHKSKGLEYPLVCLPFILNSASNRKETFGFYHDEQKQLVWDLHHQQTEKVEQEAKAEEMRLLYVALTRAKYQLIVGVPATFNAINNKSRKWDSKKLTALDYLLLGGQQHAAEQKEVSYTTLLTKTLADNYEIQVITEADEINCPMQSSAPRELSARQFHQNIEKNWRVTSFSALQAKLQALYGEHLSDNAQDYTDNTIEIDDEETAPSVMPLSIYPPHFTPFDLPKGAGVGSVLHAFLEKLDFTQPLKTPSLQTLCQYLGLDEQWLEPLRTWFNNILQQPLPEMGCLANVASADKLTEMQFYLKLGNLFNQQQFNQILSQYHPLYDQQHPVQIEEIQGVIRGFVDLVVRQNGKYYLIDYKSNFLGDGIEYYQPEKLVKAISSQRYDLQYLIYSLALHRYLKWRDPNYRYETDFGGVFYLFLRGMAVQNNAQTGVYFTKPSVELIEKLDQLWGE